MSLVDVIRLYDQHHRATYSGAARMVVHSRGDYCGSCGGPCRAPPATEAKGSDTLKEALRLGDRLAVAATWNETMEDEALALADEWDAFRAAMKWKDET